MVKHGWLILFALASSPALAATDVPGAAPRKPLTLSMEALHPGWQQPALSCTSCVVTHHVGLATFGAVWVASLGFPVAFFLSQQHSTPNVPSKVRPLPGTPVGLLMAMVSFGVAETVVPVVGPMVVLTSQRRGSAAFNLALADEVAQLTGLGLFALSNHLEASWLDSWCSCPARTASASCGRSEPPPNRATPSPNQATSRGNQAKPSRCLTTSSRNQKTSSRNQATSSRHQATLSRHRIMPSRYQAMSSRYQVTSSRCLMA